MPTVVDLFCGLGGWTEGFLAEGYKAVGIDIEEHVYGEHKYPGKLIVADVLTLHGSLFARADVLVASPPCQEFSYMAMPWSLAKAKAAKIRADTTGAEMERLNRLFNACFRIQREACEAAGRYIPLVVENVRGAQPWVGKAQDHFGSFYLWGDVPALMPPALRAVKIPMPPGGDSLTIGFQQMAKLQAVDGFKTTGMNWSDRSRRGQDFTRIAGKQAMEAEGVKVSSEEGRRTDPGKGARFTSRDCGVESGIKQGGDWFNASQPSMSRLYGSKSPQRKMASALIAKIPLSLSQHIARYYHPQRKIELTEQNP